MTYAQLAGRTNQVANALESLGIEPGDRVSTLLGRVPELYLTVIGTLKARAVYCPLFSAFGPDPVCQRLRLGEVRALVTTPTSYRHKVLAHRRDLPSLERVLLVGDHEDGERLEGAEWFDEVVGAASLEYEIAPTRPDDMALLHFTSGTTGTPKGAVHVHEAVVAHHATGTSALDLHDDDVFWCTADPGWVTGTSYGVIAPLTHGVTSVVEDGDFDASRWYRLLAEEGVTVWYTAPTALRRLMRAGSELAAEHDLSRLRFVASVGEPLNPEAVVWGQEALGLPIHDNWWQTETGGIMVANLAGAEVHPGSMGRPLPGVETTVLARGDDGRAAVAEDGTVTELDDPDTPGELALRPGWPSMFRGYLHDDERYRAAFAGGWYLTGDVVRRDRQGWMWFVGRADDVIKSSGHLIGPFEVESVLMAHPAVAEAAVIGLPDPMAGEVVKAYISLRPGFEPSDELQLDVLGFARKRLGAAVAPRTVAFADDLPKTRSGKIMRRLLKARELGLAEGDTSALESAP